MVLNSSDSKVAACMLRDHKIFAYAARTWTCAPTMKEFEALKVHLGKLYLDGKLGFPGGCMKRPKGISGLWKKINTEEHRRKVGEMTAVATFVLEAAGVSIIDVPQEKEPGLVSSIAKVRAPSAFIFPDCFFPHSRHTCKSIRQKTKRARCMCRSMSPCVSESDGDSAGAVGVQCDFSFPGAAEFALIGGCRASNKPAMSAADGTPSRTYSCTRSAMPVGGLGVLLGQMPSRAEAERRTSECISRCSRPLSACRARAQRTSCLVRAISWWFGTRQFGPAHPASDRYGSMALVNLWLRFDTEKKLPKIFGKKLCLRRKVAILILTMSKPPMLSYGGSGRTTATEKQICRFDFAEFRHTFSLY